MSPAAWMAQVCEHVIVQRSQHEEGLDHPPIRLGGAKANNPLCILASCCVWGGREGMQGAKSHAHKGAGPRHSCIQNLWPDFSFLGQPTSTQVSTKVSGSLLTG